MNLQVPDVEAGANRDQRTDEMVAFLADAKGAHKLCRLRISEHGFMLFESIGILYCYLACHFGGAWSSTWWARPGGALHRLLHLLLWSPHQGWLYVDDWLWRLLAASAGEDAALLVLFLMTVGCPLSFQKLDLGEEVLWIGLLVIFRLSTWALPEGKFERMRAYLRMLAEAGDILSRNQAEAGQGLMIWITQTFPQDALVPAPLLRSSWAVESHECLTHS